MQHEIYSLIKELAGIKDFITLVTASSQNEKFLKILRDPQYTFGWLISERFINIPAHIAPPLYASLWLVQTDMQACIFFKVVNYLFLR